jgi:uncharacterized protein (DUF1330 family)
MMRVVKNVILAEICVVVMTVLAGCTSQSQTMKNTKPVYMIAEVQVLDEKLYAEYAAKAGGIVEKYNGRYLVRGDKIVPLAGNWNPQRVIVMEFPSLEQAQAWYNSPEYRAIAPLREQSTKSRAIIVEGVERK